MKRGGLLAVVVLLTAIGSMRAAPEAARRVDPQLAAAAQETQYTFDEDGRYLNFTAVLTDPETGEPLSDGLDVLDLSIWDAATDGNELWREQQHGIVIDRGVLSIRLGVATPLPRDIFDGRALWLEIAPNGTVLEPRILLTRSATSVYSETASDVECGTLPREEGEERDEPTGEEQKEEPLTEGDELGCISDYEIRPDSVGTEEIKDGSITGADVQDESLTGQDIEDGSIHDVDLATDSVGNEELKDNSVGTNEIQDGSVSKNDLGANSVDGTKVVDNSLTGNDIQDGSVHDVDLATDSVGNEELKDNSVGTNEIQNGSVTSDDVADGSLTGTDVADNSLTSDDLGSNSVGTDELADSSVTTNEIADGTISTDDIADDAVTSAHIADGTISAGDLDGELLNLITSQPGGKPGQEIIPVAMGTLDVTDVDVALAVSGYPLIAAVDGSTTVRLIVCSDTTCGTNSVRTFSLPSGADAATVAIIVGNDGLPIIATPAGTIACDDALCGAATMNFDGAWSSYAPVVDAHLGPNGRPWIVFPDSATECEDAQCSTGYPVSTWSGVYHSFDFTVRSATVDPDGALVVAGHTGLGWNSGQARVARCPVADYCSTAAELQLMNVGTSAVTIGSDGMPVVAFQTSGWSSNPYDDEDPEDQAPGVHVIRCTAVDCSSSAAPQHTSAGSWATELGATQATDGSALFTVTDATSAAGSVTVMRCSGDSCVRISKTSVNPQEHDTFDATRAAAVTIGVDDAPFLAIAGRINDVVGPGAMSNAVHAVHCANRYCVPNYRQH